MLSRVLLAALAAGVALAPVAGQAATKKEPPSCAAISFRPIPAGTGDGEQEAGLYKSRFGKIELKTTVTAGRAGDYFMTVNGKKPEPLAGALPKHVERCLASKHVVVPVKTADQGCVGDRFRVVIDRSGKEKLMMLFALYGNEWRYCTASAV